jgi:hypothetical protein
VAVYVGMDLWIRLRRHDREPDPVPVPLDAADGPAMTPIPCPPAEPGTPG